MINSFEYKAAHVMRKRDDLMFGSFLFIVTFQLKYRYLIGELEDDPLLADTNPYNR